MTIVQIMLWWFGAAALFMLFLYCLFSASSRLCQRCAGSGRWHDKVGVIKCDRCRGTGRIK
jgi:hypothetical protein